MITYFIHSLHFYKSKIYRNLIKKILFIYLGFYVAFNTVQVISRWIVGRAEETSRYSSTGFYTVNCQPPACKLSHLKLCTRWVGGSIVTTVILFNIKATLTKHQKICAKLQHLSPKLFRCSNCSETLPNRRDLYHHRVTQHGGAEVNALQQEVELVNPPWLNEQEVTDKSLQSVYDNNRLHILALHTGGRGEKI